MMNSSPKERIKTLLKDLYGGETAKILWVQLSKIISEFSKELSASGLSPESNRLSQQDQILITYGDMVQESELLPLQSLTEFARRHLKGVVKGIHILPFYPYSSDDGFSVIDYWQVDPALGTWQDIAQLGNDFKLMFDAVINHISAESPWFRGFLEGKDPYQDYFITISGDPDLTQVVRPRTSPLLTPFMTNRGTIKVWTTFSADQIDLNYKNPELLLKIIELLLFYILRGANFIRLDAIAFLWKEPGTTCIHLPQTHKIVQLFRAVLDWAAPYVRLITETNVPHIDNISYFGDGTNEAHLVYNFALPPLLLHTFRTSDCRVLTKWAATLSLPSDQTTYFNFLASHDGIGLNPARGLIAESEIQALVEQTLRHGGLVNSKANPDGTTSPYELNINYYDALNNPQSDEPMNLQVDRFICSQAIMLALTGVPGIYFHSLFGSRGWPEGVKIQGHNRAINRRKLERNLLEAALEDADSRESRVFTAYKRLLRVRSAVKAFDPYGSQEILECGQSIFGLIRNDPAGLEPPVVCLHNITGQLQSVSARIVLKEWASRQQTRWFDLITREEFRIKSEEAIQLEPYQIKWLSMEKLSSPDLAEI